jgi:hypothetical protein
MGGLRQVQLYPNKRFYYYYVWFKCKPYCL